MNCKNTTKTTIRTSFDSQSCTIQKYIRVENGKIYFPKFSEGIRLKEHRQIDGINVAGILRLIQEIPTKKAEPFKKWLAKTGFERIQEQQNPDLITQE